MRLLTKTSRYYLLFASLIFLVCGIAFYFVLKYIIIKKADESLLADKILISIQIDDNEDINNLFLDLTDNYLLKEVSISKEIKDGFSTIYNFDKKENEYEPYRQLITSINKNGKNYELTIQKSLVEFNDLIYSIATVVFTMLAILVVSFTVFNQTISIKLWHPFNDTLEKLKQFRVESTEKEAFTKTDIQEFTELNNVAEKLTYKIRKDYHKQKNFIDNVAHEIQTPLAIVNANIDLLIQSSNLKEYDIQLIQVIHDTINRLARINNSLLLLSKIENNQFTETVPVDITTIVTEYINILNNRIESKKLTISVDIFNPILVNINSELAEILIGNLIQNAVRHNLEEGQIWVRAIGKTMEIGNTGGSFDGPTDKLFEKFFRIKKSKESIGLGLAIVQQICDLYQIKISYNLKGEIHRIQLVFA